MRRQRRMIRSGVAAADIKPWKFQAQMEFLVRYMVNENRDTNFPDDDVRLQAPSEEDEHVESESQHMMVTLLTRGMMKTRPYTILPMLKRVIHLIRLQTTSMLNLLLHQRHNQGRRQKKLY